MAASSSSVVADENDENLTLTLHLDRTLQSVGERGSQRHSEDSPVSVRERITLRGLHSSGGIGEVWRAYDEVLGREVALKRLRRDKADSASSRARFFREARLTGQLDHPGVVPVYDFTSTEDGRSCFYTMRFLRGRTLLEVIAEFHEQRHAQGQPLVSSRFVELLGDFVSVCNTVAFAHSRGVIHRDLKGDNVIVGDYGEVVVLDWGLAKQLEEPRGIDRASPPAREPDQIDASQTQQGQLLGTPAYMAPEQALGHIDRIDPRTDVYGLAAILYEILTGEPPFRAGTLDEIMDAVVQTPPIAPSDKVPGVPPQLERVCLRGLAKGMDDRVQSAAELAAEVRSWLTALAEQRRTEQERERFFDLSMDLLAIVDREGKLSQSNAAWNRLLGWSASVRAEKRFIDLVVEEDRERAVSVLTEIWAGAGGGELEVRVLAANRGRRWVHWNLRSIPEEGAVYLVGRDVTLRRRSERQLAAVLEAAPDAMIVVDRGQRIVLINRRTEELFGYARDELIGQPLEIMIPERLHQRHAEHVRRFAEQPSPRSMGGGRPLLGRRRDGSEFAVRVSLSPVATDDGVMICSAIRPADDE
jgi:PAS domain S-box-containing protein